MTRRVDVFDSTYAHFTDRVRDAVRKETFGTDIGHNSWVTEDEYERLLPWFKLPGGKHALEAASGSGGPALYLARTGRCRVTGTGANASGVATAAQPAKQASEGRRGQFRLADANQVLPFDEGSFDALPCCDSVNHFPDRLSAFPEWHRVLRKGGRALFTDPVVITGPVTNDELALRSSTGLFLFVPPGVNERLIGQAGFRLHDQVLSPPAPDAA
jgi:SAM-dependent methyltransferase